MLCVNNYDQEYVDECRARMQSQLAAYNKLLKTARAKARTDAALKSAMASLEPLFFNNLVVVLNGLGPHARGRRRKESH